MRPNPNHDLGGGEVDRLFLAQKRFLVFRAVPVKKCPLPRYTHLVLGYGGWVVSTKMKIQGEEYPTKDLEHLYSHFFSSLISSDQRGFNQNSNSLIVVVFTDLQS